MLRICIAALMILWTIAASAQGIDQIIREKQELRVQRTIKWFSTYGQSLDSTGVRLRHDSLMQASAEKKDPSLEIAALCMMGEYYRSSRVSDPDAAAAAYEKALSAAQKKELTRIIPLLVHELGNIYYKQEKYTPALEFLLRANMQMQQIGFDKFPDNGKYLYDLGYAFAYNFEDFQNAKSYLSAAIRSTFPDVHSEIQCYNMLGLVHRTLHNPDSSMYYFNLALGKAMAVRDSASIGDISGNIGYHYFVQQEYDKAIPLFQDDYRTGLKEKNWVTATLSALILADIDAARGHTGAAHEKIRQARGMIDSIRQKHPNKAVYTAYYSLYTVLARLSRNAKNDAATVGYLDSLMMYKDSLYHTKDGRIQSAVQIRLLQENNKYELELMKSEERRKLLLRNALLLISLLVIIIIIQVLYRLKIKSRKDAEQLSLYADALFEKNQLLEQVKSEVRQMKADPPAPGADTEEILERLRSFTILTEQQWKDFKALFEKIYKNFFDNISQKIPDLTQAEMRLLALTKLGLSTKQMAEMQGISAESIRKAKYRLRKKIELKVREYSENFTLLKNL